MVLLAPKLWLVVAAIYSSKNKLNMYNNSVCHCHCFAIVDNCRAKLNCPENRVFFDIESLKLIKYSEVC